jgi:hypothetical protein
MPVRIEERPHRAAIRQRSYGLCQRVRILGQPAVHQDNAIEAGARDHVLSRSGKQENIVT